MHLFKVFKPNSREIVLEEENKLFSDDTTSAIRLRGYAYKALYIFIYLYQRSESYNKKLGSKDVGL
jgi:hypothetical protein